MEVCSGRLGSQSRRSCFSEKAWEVWDSVEGGEDNELSRDRSKSFPCRESEKWQVAYTAALKHEKTLYIQEVIGI